VSTGAALRPPRQHAPAIPAIDDAIGRESCEPGTGDRRFCVLQLAGRVRVAVEREQAAASRARPA
jgi:hypothetical protein